MLTEEEKREIIDLLLEDKPLPEKYRSRLFRARKELNHEDHGLEARILEEHSPDWPDGDPSRPYNPVWPNRLFWGDNLDVMRFLLSAEIGPDQTRTGGIKLIYIDPPFNAGSNFYINYQKDFSTCSPLAYTDIWKNGLDGCLEWLAPRLCLMRELLADDGSIFVHCDWRLNARMRLLLDDIFGFHVNEIIWHYTGGGRSARCFSHKHDSIFIYSKNRNFNFYPDQIRIPYASTSSYAKNGITARSGKKYLPNPLGAVPDDVWNIPIINPLSHERNAYPTQKPEALLKRIILSCTKPGDLVADFFCGSGVTAVVAEKLGRKWLISDIGFPAIHLSRKRLDNLFKAKSGLPAASPFSIWTVRPAAHMREALFPASLFTLREENGILLAHGKDDLWLVFPEHAIANWEEITHILREHSPDYDNIFVLASAWTRNCLEDGRRSGIWRKTCFHLLNLPLHINPGLSLSQQCGPALFPSFQFQPKPGMLALEMTDLQWGADFLKNGLAYRPDSARKKADKSLGIVCWKKLLDSWALDPAFQLSCNERRNQSPLSFKPFWQSDRSGGKNEPELLSPFIACSQISRIAVKVTDIFFNESLILMDGKAAS